MEMNKKYAIFDMDGTLIDSMKYWKNLGREYLSKFGITENLDEIMEKIKPMTMTESAELFRKEFDLPGTKESIAEEMNWMIEEHYRNDIPLKDGVKEYISKLYEMGVSMCVASATDKDLMRVCLGRLGVLEYFQFLLSCEEVGVGKNRPDVYYEALFHLKKTESLHPEDVAVYEDAAYAIRTATDAGFYTIAVYDDSNRGKWEKLKEQSKEAIFDWNQALQSL